MLRDQRNRSSLIGIFQAIHTVKFPSVTKSFTVFFSLSEVVVPTTLSLIFRDIQQEKILKEVIIECRQVVEPEQPYEINADFHDVSFDHDGKYDFELRSNGQLLAIRTLCVLEAQ